MNLDEIVSRRHKYRLSPSEEDLRRLPDRFAYVYARVSTTEQIHESEQSIKEIGLQVALARNDGYKTGLSQEEVDRRIQAILKGSSNAILYWEDCELIIDCRDLGISGQLSEAKRPGLANLRKQLEAGKIGCLYLTEGMSRLSRDQDRIISHQMLKLLKEQQCRVRTPDGLWNPAIERDWEYLHEELEDAAEEKKLMGKRLRRRRNNKAKEGRHVGTPVVPGFIVEIEGQRPDGRFILGKWKAYPPHAEVVNLVLKSLVETRSLIKSARSLWKDNIVFPFFPPELKYMESRSQLRACHRTASGYAITPALIKGLAQNPALIGVWSFSNQAVIQNNHDHIMKEDIFWQACEIAVGKGKPRGKAVNFEPLPFSGLLWCTNHQLPERISSHSSDGTYVCNHAFNRGQGSICIDISHKILDTPLLQVVLEQLDFTPYADDILVKLEAQYDVGTAQENFRQKQETDMEQRIKQLKSYLGSADREKEETYWSLIREAQSQLEQLRAQPVTQAWRSPLNISLVRNLLARIKSDWEGYSAVMRNNLLQIFLERVEVIVGKKQVEATIIWKAGLRQKLMIQRPVTNAGRDKVWSTEEKILLRELWPSATKPEIEASLPSRTWKGMAGVAHRLGISRQGVRTPSEIWRPWTAEEDRKFMKQYYHGDTLDDIAIAVGRSPSAVGCRVQVKNLQRPRPQRRMIPAWQVEENNLIVSDASCRGKQQKG
jgi:DNA invertase Pin-like site-specific DNA recombinase/ribosomal protein L29